MSKLHDNPFRPDYDNGTPDTPELDRLRAINAELVAALKLFCSCAYPVAQEIHPLGHNWTRAYLDAALPIARAALAKAGA